jgi:plastocyanin
MNLRIATLFAALWTLAGATPHAAPRSHLVRLAGNQFTPPETHASPGDTIRFVNRNGGPHNVQFVRDSLSPAALAALDAAMPGEKIATLSSPLLLDDETYTIVIPRLEPGRYPFVCLPHQANMRGVLIVP